MISIIVVVGKNREIGYKNRLLWALPKDMQRFKKITIDHKVVMGDRTFESIGTALPRRENIVVSLNDAYKAEGCEVKNSLEGLLEEYKESEEEIFIIGGGTIYNLALPFADKLYITVVDDSPKADTFFPDYCDFKTVVNKDAGIDNGIGYIYYELVR